MKISYYPGCSLHGTALEYDASLRSVCRLLGIELVEIEDWNCCGASSAHCVNEELSVLLPARNLALAEGLGRSELLVPCSACYNRLKFAHSCFTQDRSWIEKVSYQGGLEILHLHEFFARPDLLELIKSKVKYSLEALKIIPYYGCLAVRNPKVVNHPNPENPTEMEAILEVLGSTPLRWSYKVDCCGGNLSLTRPDIAQKLSGDLFDAALEAGGESIVTDCPLCQANLDTRQREISRERETDYNLPVFYITELMGIALGCNDSPTWWEKHLVDPGRIAGQAVPA